MAPFRKLLRCSLVTIWKRRSVASETFWTQPNHIADTPITNRQPRCIWSWLRPWNEHGRDSRRFWRIWMSKTLRQRIFEDTGYDHLSPISIARDQRLRALYETYIAAKDTTEEEQAYQAFVKFVREEYLCRPLAGGTQRNRDPPFQRRVHTKPSTTASAQGLPILKEYRVKCNQQPVIPRCPLGTH